MIILHDFQHLLSSLSYFNKPDFVADTVQFDSFTDNKPFYDIYFILQYIIRGIQHHTDP